MKTIAMTDFAALYDADTLVVDVREPAEYVSGHVPRAILMPLSTVPAHRDELPRDKTVYVICASGNRSKLGSELIASIGLDAISVDGGTSGWIRLGRDVVTGTQP